MAAMWQSFFSFLTNQLFSYGEYVFNFFDVIIVEMILALIGIVFSELLLFWIKDTYSALKG